MDAEPRAQRQLIANLRRERIRTILLEMPAPRLAHLLSVLPHDDMAKLMHLLPQDEAKRIEALISNQEVTASILMSRDFMAVPKDIRVGSVLKDIRISKQGQRNIFYVYIVSPDNVLLLPCPCFAGKNVQINMANVSRLRNFTTASIWNVCGNMSTGWMASTV